MVARRNPAVPRRTVHVAGCPVQTTVTARPAVARRWVYTTLWRERRRLHSSSASGGGGLTVGLGVQWTPPPYRTRLPAGAEPRPGTLQLCVGNRCLVFQLARAGAGAAPQILRRFLSDGRVTFAGYYVASDCRKLRAHHGLEVETTLELCSAGGGAKRESLAALAERLLGIRHGVEKSAAAGRSRWDGPKLSRKQVRYAVVDAYLSCRLGVHLRRRAAVMAVDREESESEYYYSDEDDDGFRYTASREEEAPEEEEGDYDEHRRDWDGFLGGNGRRDDDWDDAAVDDHLYDSVFACALSCTTQGEPSICSPWC
ncbi:unnamed protein product [Urochloa decumbens]|uniref:3'-5' exonuclease domain-containing protein n=1 Tax=Urochloa decumbens TaxID=240449 RepID=A0ABC9FM26_9POAL